MAGPETSLALAADIERRDVEVAAMLELVLHLGRRADDIRARSDQLQLILDNAPGELAALERRDAGARDAEAAAMAAVAAAEQHVAALEGGRRHAGAAGAARRELELAQEGAEAASVRLRHIGAERAQLIETEAAARAEGGELVERADEVAARIQSVPRVSQTGREAPGGGLAGLAEWGARVHAALFVVRGQLEAERDRLVREANELAGAALGEQVAGSSVSLVRQRLEAELRR